MEEDKQKVHRPVRKAETEKKMKKTTAKISDTRRIVVDRWWFIIYNSELELFFERETVKKREIGGKKNSRRIYY